MSLPTSNLKLTDIAGVFDESQQMTPPYEMEQLFLHSQINGQGLDPVYCPGADATARLANLRTTPYNMGKLRAYNHVAGSSLNAINCSVTTSSDPCTAMLSTTTVYCLSSSLNDAYSSSNPIYTDSSGLNVAANAWYSDVANRWYSFESGFWRNDTSCSSLTAVLVSGPVRSAFEVCALSGKALYYYHDGSNQVPVAGDMVYTNQQGSSTPDPGYYKVDSMTDWHQIGSGGLVTQNGKCP